MKSTAVALIALALAMLTSRASAQTQPAAKPATQEVKADLTTPKGAMKVFMNAMLQGDAEGAKKAAIADADQARFIDEMSGATASFKKLNEAATAKFGDKGKALAPFATTDARAEMLDSADEAIVDDTATVSVSPIEKVSLKKVGSDWKVDMSKMPNMDQMKQALPMFSMMKKFADEFATEINAGKYATADDAKTAMENKMRDIIMAQAQNAATTLPASTQPDAAPPAPPGPPTPPRPRRRRNRARSRDNSRNETE